MKIRISSVVIVALLVVLAAVAQQSGSNTVAGSGQVVPPPLIQFSDTTIDEGGSPLTGSVSITFALYANRQGGAPLWTETQSVQLDATGHYSVQLGITKPNGVPTALFTSGEARWLGVQIAGQPEQSRVLFVSVPYALKAGDAATLGGLPPSAFLLATPANADSAAAAAFASNAPTPSGAVTGTGTVNFLPLWDTTSDIVSSALFQSGSGSTAKIGINTTTPASTLDVKGGGTFRGTLNLPASGTATATAGKNSQPLAVAASAFNSSSAAAVKQMFQLQAEPFENNSTTPSATLNLLFASGTGSATETGLKISNSGQITFASGQTFPGAGTITGVTTANGSGLTGGGTSGSLNLALTNSCATNQVLQWNGVTWACASAGAGTVTSVSSGAGLTGGPITGSGTLSIATGGVSNGMLANPSFTLNAGTGLTGGGAVSLGGSATLNVDTTKIPQLATGNTFTGPVVVTESSQATALTGTQTASTGQTWGVEGFITSTTSNAAGVLGVAFASTGNAAGVFGETNSSGGIGVYGAAPAGGVGVYSAGDLDNTGDLRMDILGRNSGSVSPGIRFGTGGTGEGISSNRTGAVNQNGIDLYTNFTQRLSVTNTGYIGIATTAPANQLDIHAQSTQILAVNGLGANAASGSGSYGGSAISGYGGTGDPLNAPGGGGGVFGQGGNGPLYGGQGVTGFGGSGTSLDGPGGYFVGGLSSTGGDGVLGEAGTGYAGNFRGNINVQGAVIASVKDFKIDHPLDPANKYLVHASVESSEMMNIYTGNVTTNAQGEASVRLPEWFEVLNADFRYQLTVIGVFAQAIVSREIVNHEFKIRTNLPNVKVSWQVTGVRQDAYAKAHPLVVEEQKDERLRGFYIHPELYGAPEEKQVEWARHAEIMRRLNENRKKQSAAGATK